MYSTYVLIRLRTRGFENFLLDVRDGINCEPLNRGLRALLGVLRLAICSLLPVDRINPEPELTDHLRLSSKWISGFSYELFICEWPADFGCIKKYNAAFDGFAYTRNHFLLVCSGTISMAHSHAAKPDR